MAAVDFSPPQRDQWADPRWRLHNIYWIIDEGGIPVPFRPNEEQDEFLRDLWYLNVILKARQIGFCLSAETRILTADLRWVAIGDVAPGQEIVAVDEHAPGGKGHARKMRTAVVQAAQRVRRQAFRITLDDGRTLTCTGQHPWLSQKAGSGSAWRKIEGGSKKRLTVGTKVRWITKPWENGTQEDGWFGGMLDGEGSLDSRGSPSVNVSQLRGPVWDRMQRYLTERGYHFCIESDKAERKSKHGKVPVPKVVVGRMDEMFRLLGQTQPTRFARRWWEGRELPGKKTGVGWATITAIEKLGVQTMVDLQTSTGTYIAEGFVSHNTTMIDLMILDQCFFVPNTTAGIVAHNLDDATKIFRNKIKYPHSRLPESLRRANPLVKESESEFVWKNGSSVSVGTSMRSGTLQYLHVSELGKIARKFPEKAREIRTGALNAVHEGHYVFVESTAEGRGGDFYELVQIAKKLRESRGKLTTLDFKLHFYPWWKKESYAIDASGVTLTKEDREYFDGLEQDHGVKLTPNQKAWYVKKAAVQKGDIRQEYPSHEEEAFEAANEEKYWLKVMLELRRKERIRDLPIIPDRPVNLLWDIGNDMTSIWFHQFIANEHRLIDFYQNSGEEMAHYLVKLQRLPYLYGGILLPHDANDTGVATHDPAATVRGIVKKAFPNCVVKVVPRTPNKLESIDRARSFLRGCWFHESNAATGIACMENYRKQWNDKTGMWRDEPFHDKYSHGSDAFMQLSDGWSLIADADFNPGKVFRGQFGRVGDREVNY